jgi:hypothetical protein
LSLEEGSFFRPRRASSSLPASPASLTEFICWPAGYLRDVRNAKSLSQGAPLFLPPSIPAHEAHYNPKAAAVPETAPEEPEVAGGGGPAGGSACPCRRSVHTGAGQLQGWRLPPG